MLSTAEAELGALYIKSKFAAPIWHMLTERGHPLPPTPIKTDNYTAFGVVTNKLYQR